MTHSTQTTGGRQLRDVEPQPLGEHVELADVEEKAVTGRDPETPALLLTGLSLVIFSFAALLIIAALLIWWLV